MLQIKNISKTYRTKKGFECKALDDVAFDLGEKGLVFVLGKSGSGKSTLLNVISGLDSPDEGEIIIDNKSSKEFNAEDFDVYRNSYVGFIFQEFSIIDEITVGENIALALQLQNLSAAAEDIAAILKKVDLEGYENRSPKELSGGQKQRVAIARALVKDPKIIFGDEPTGALDSKTGVQILQLFKELAETKLVIVVSHDRDSALTYGDRIIELADGKIIADKTKKADIDFSNLKHEYQEKIDAAFKNTGEIKHDEKRKFQSVKTSLPFKHAVKIAFSNFSAKKIRFIATVLLTVIALSMFGISLNLKNYDGDLAAVNTYSKLDIDTWMLVNTIVTEEDGETEYTPTQFKNNDIQRITDYGLTTYRSYRFSLSVPKFRESSETPLYRYDNQITCFVEMGENFDAGMLNNFYHAKLTAGNYPKQQNDCVEILISDYIADSIMFYGGKLYNWDANSWSHKSVNVYPNTGYDNILGKELSYGGFRLRITGIYSTDYKELDFSIRRHFRLNFNLQNVYKTVLTTNSAFQSLVDTHRLFPMSVYMSYFDHNDPVDDDGEEKMNYIVDPYQFTIIKYEPVLDMLRKYPLIPESQLDAAEEMLNSLNPNDPDYDYKINTPIKNFMLFKPGYNIRTKLNDNDIIISYAALQDILNKYDVGYEGLIDRFEHPENYGAGDSYFDIFESIELEFTLFALANDPVFSNINIVGVYNHNAIPEAAADALENSSVAVGSSLDMLMFTNQNFFGALFENYFAVANLFALGSNDKAYNLAALQFLKAGNFQCLTYATNELASFDVMFLLITDVLDVASLIMFLFVMLLIYNFISASISGKQKEIGILRAMGARGKDVAKIFMFESMMLCLIDLILCFILIPLGLLGINALITKGFTTPLELITINFFSFLIIAGASIAITALASLLPLYFISKKKPTDAIRTG